MCGYHSLPLIYHSLTTPVCPSLLQCVCTFCFLPRSWACASSLARNPSWPTESGRGVYPLAWLEECMVIQMVVSVGLRCFNWMNMMKNHETVHIVCFFKHFLKSVHLMISQPPVVVCW